MHRRSALSAIASAVVGLFWPGRRAAAEPVRTATEWASRYARPAPVPKPAGVSYFTWRGADGILWKVRQHAFCQPGQHQYHDDGRTVHCRRCGLLKVIWIRDLGKKPNPWNVATSLNR